jgi:hypothetical protein
MTAPVVANVLWQKDLSLPRREMLKLTMIAMEMILKLDLSMITENMFDIENGTVNEDGKNHFWATHGRVCETCTGHEISSSTLEMSSDIEQWT